MSESLVGRAVLRILKKNGVVGAIGIAEQIMDAIDLFGGDEGMSEAPRELSKEMGWDIRDNAPRQVAREQEKIQQPPKASSSIIMPGDPEFNKATKPTLVESESGKTIVAPEVRIRPKKSNAVERQYWDMADLQRAIMENFPQRIDFEVEKDGRMVPLYALQNVICQQGLGNVMLTYKHPSVSTDTHGGTYNTSIAINMALVAQWSFSVYEEKIDIDTVMNGPKGIMTQLVGLYSPRPETMAPARIPDPGLRIENAFEGAYERIDLQPGYDPAPGHSGDNFQLQSVKQSLRQSHDRLAPPGSRFNT